MVTQDDETNLQPVARTGTPQPGGPPDRVVVITGASSGIGRATALHLAGRGAAVVLGARRTERLEEVAQQIRTAGGRVALLATDVTEAGDVKALVDLAVQEFGRVDVVVANAGISRIGPVADLDVAGWEAMVQSNLSSVLHTTAAALPVFRSQGRGHLVAVVSTAGIKIAPNQAVYAATKNAVRTFVEALRQESTDGVLRTTSVSPGYVRTELIDSAVTDPTLREQMSETMARDGLPPEAVARAIAFAVEQPHDVEIGDITLRPTVQG